MNRIAILFFVAGMFFLCNSPVSAQNRRNQVYELHLGGVATNVFGDVGSGFQLSQTRPAVYIGGRYDVNESFSAKVNFFAGRTAGTDEGTDNDLRKYSFSSSIYEVSAQGEWNFLRIGGKKGLSGASSQTRPYLFVGVGFVFSEPVFAYNQVAEILPDGGSVKETAGGLAIPFGLGIRTDLNRFWAVGLEIGFRYCTSDYLDGLAIESPKSNDLYCFTSLHLAYKFHFTKGKLEKKR
ncbi:MAG: DUF6089 family protein [Bacteroidales bacterium]|jgi:hypothetical protein|nr:DUF6089 family protein [Bacteroidales bacterium]